MKSYKLIIITPEKEVFNENINMLSSESSEGKFQILARHEPIIIGTIPTITKIVDEKGNNKSLFTSNGILKAKGEEVVFCVDSAEWPQDIDKSRAERAKERAEKRLASGTDIDVRRAKIALAKAMARLTIK